VLVRAGELAWRQRCGTRLGQHKAALHGLESFVTPRV
jgi:hypothetical protein